MKFLRSSLDSLVKNLGKDYFKYLSQEFDNNVLNLVKQKGFYPDKYMSNFDEFKKQLPSKEKFYSLLTGKKISDKEYEVWNKFERKTMKDYHYLYLKYGLLLLADVFEKFRNNSLKNYGLCPSHYLSAPALNWGEMLNMTKVELELITDPDMYTFVEKGMRAAVSYISNRYSQANNKYLMSYDLKQESKHIIYLDANNLYCYEVSKFFPTSRFKWIDPKEFDLNKYTSNSSKGLFSKLILNILKSYENCIMIIL